VSGGRGLPINSLWDEICDAHQASCANARIAGADCRISLRISVAFDPYRVVGSDYARRAQAEKEKSPQGRIRDQGSEGGNQS
jgi:hypothetical protein